jgi:hypothetical protein
MRRSNNKLSTPAAWTKGAFSLLSSVLTRVILALFCISVFAGCDTVSGTKTPMNIGALSKINNLEVQVRVDEDFSVVLAGERMNANDTLFLFNGALHAASEGALLGIRGQEDAQRAKNLHMAIAEIKLQSLTQKALVDGLQTSLRFKSVTAVNERAEKSPDGAGILLVRIENWGLYAGSKENASLQKVQVGLNATASLVGGDGKLAWEHKDYFTGGVHRPIAEYGSSPYLLKSEIEETVGRYCARVVNEIRYAQ